ncbi:hypothetical protein KSF_086660 [Reticulibacter mediterranei]|uniref:Uncharacterized protein n=1 Tax=Reticulibacter mediterranei TaxID=2778369 RepID=A0A8J3N7H7_9CHLR|nr:hypothetical protein KSF_086660 [Reticulibacter mediterranei]
MQCCPIFVAQTDFVDEGHAVLLLFFSAYLKEQPGINFTVVDYSTRIGDTSAQIIE